jgi:hypothetical protein
MQGEQLLVGVGDRVSWIDGYEYVSLPDQAIAQGLRPDLFEIWLPRGWSEHWVERDVLQDLARRGITPVVVHYFFGDAISAERFEAQRDDWYASLWRMARLVRMREPVLVVLEPEFNIAPPEGETALVDAPWLADDLRAAARLIREQAPNARVGVCPGDFSPTRGLEPLLGAAAPELDFLAFQEMRAATDPDAGGEGYLELGDAAVDYARYLRRAFGLPLLLAYVAVSSYDGWERAQAEALASLVARRDALARAGVFGVVYFQLRDDPDHRGYFGPAERNFGLLRADGTPKPALDAFLELQR